MRHIWGYIPMNPEVTVAGADYLDTFLKEINVFE